MARQNFGGSASDFVFGTYPFAGKQLIDLQAATLTFWSAETGGTQYTSLLLNGSPVTEISVGVDGQIPTFQGPDGVGTMWASANGGARVLLAAPGQAGPAGATGATGAAGPGVPTGGTTGQVLAKTSGTDYATGWVAQTGGSTGQPLQQVATTVTASGAAVANKHNPADATAAARTISLPTGQAEGTQISVEKVDSSTNAVAITGNIRGVAASTISLSYQSESLMLRADAAGSWWPIAGHRTKSSLDAAYTPAVDNLALTRLERQEAAKVRTLSLRNAARAADSTVFTESWTALTAWTQAVSAQVASSRVFGTANPWAVQRGISVAAGQRCTIRTSIKLVNGTSGYVTMNNDAVNGAINGTVANGWGVGFNTTTGYAQSKGANCTGSAVTDWDGSPASGTDYFITVVIDENDISWTIGPEGSMPKYAARIARSQLPGGPAVNNILLSGSGTTAGGTTFGPLSIQYETTVPPLASRVVGGKTLFDSSRHVVYIRYDSTTGIRHMIGVPGTYDPRVPAPVLVAIHGATGHAGWAFSINQADTRRLAVTQAFLADGYIVVSSDNGTNHLGSPATDATDNKYSQQVGTDDYAALIAYVRDHFNTGAVVLEGESMGGGHVQQMLSQRVVGGIAAAISVCPGNDVVAAESDVNYQAGIWAAWGATDHASFLAAIAGKNPINLQGYALRGVPQAFFGTSDDPIAPPAVHIEPLRQRILTYAPEATVTLTTGGHVAASAFQPAAKLAFANKYAR